jgi:hypothetical protein
MRRRIGVSGEAVAPDNPIHRVFRQRLRGRSRTGRLGQCGRPGADAGRMAGTTEQRIPGSANSWLSEEQGVKERGLSTELIHRGEDEPLHADALNVPIYGSTTFLFENAEDVRRYQEGKSAKYLYQRYANPTIVVAEEKLAALDRAESARLFASGMAAISTLLLTFLKPGDELITNANTIIFFIISTLSICFFLNNILNYFLYITKIIVVIKVYSLLPA